MRTLAYYPVTVTEHEDGYSAIMRPSATVLRDADLDALLQRASDWATEHWDGSLDDLPAGDVEGGMSLIFVECLVEAARDSCRYAGNGIMTTREAAERLGVTITTVGEYCRQGRLVSAAVGNGRAIESASVEQLASTRGRRRHRWERNHA